VSTRATRLRIDLAYDGAPFAGFARQRDQITVQGTLEGALQRLTGQDVRCTCAGRTDRGVHALAQVVHLDLDEARPRAATWLRDLEVARQRLDHLVGHAISIWQVARAPAGFDARFSATGRGYRYRIVDAAVSNPVVRHDRWHLGAPLDLAAMRAGAKHLLGEHDFASFCRRAPGRTTRRRLDELAVTRPGWGRVEVRLAGPAFCHQQVRSIVGCLVVVGRGERDPGWLAEVLLARDRSVAPRIAPAHGLTLERVTYGRGVAAAPPVFVRS
jgi:tRNA pseudouridine38-40 synthase